LFLSVLPAQVRIKKDAEPTLPISILTSPADIDRLQPFSLWFWSCLQQRDVPASSGRIAIWMAAIGNSRLNEMQFAQGKVGHALAFGPNSDYVYAWPSSSLNVGFGPGFTLEFWIKAAPTGRFDEPLAEWENGVPGVRFWISAAEQSFFVDLLDTKGAHHLLNAPPNLLTPNLFQHLALSYDRASGIAALYCNGAVVVSQLLGSFDPVTRYSLFLGREPYNAVEVYTGLLDEVSLYNRALSAQEISAIYSADSGGKCPTFTAPTVLGQPEPMGSCSTTFMRA
jgi:concanavalin A-like lectin/glucanase superfamily protein